MAYLILFGGVLLLMLAGIIYLFTRFRKLAGRHKKAGIAIAVILTLALAFWCWTSPYYGIIPVIHLAAFWLIFDIAAAVVRKMRKRSPDDRKLPYYVHGIAVLVITVVYMGIAYYLAHHVYETDYSLTTDKNLGVDSIRIVQISDSHVGSCFDGEGFADHMKTIQKVNPDILVITGDFVDDDTTREDMVRSCRALGEIKTTYGIYFVFGNHDKGYYNSRDFTADELAEELIRNNVTVLEDEIIPITPTLLLIGRQDKGVGNRAPISELVDGLGDDSYKIVLDHQPNDYDNEEKAGVDLVLSGHTHGGQMIPIIHSGEWSGVNDMTYGIDVRSGTTFIVSSGIADWAVPYRTGCIAEFVVIDLAGASQ